MSREYEFHVGPSNFGVTKEQLDNLNASLEPTEALEDLGGLEKLVERLHSDLRDGIHDSDLQPRRTTFGANNFPESQIPSFFSLLLEALKDEMLIILIIAAIISLVLGVAFPGEVEPGVPPTTTQRIEGSIEGAAILGAVAIVSLVQAGNNYIQERQFQKLNKVKQNVQVKVQRKGVSTQCSIHDIVVGDIVILGTGNQIPADGFYISGYNCTCNESGMTGESEPSKKSEKNRQMLSGCYVITGDCTMVVTAVGLSSRWGKALKDLDEASEGRETPLQEKLGKLARYIGYIGLVVAFLVFVVLTIYFIVDELTDNKEWEWRSLETVLENFIIAVTIVVVAVPEGLPLAVTMALAYSLMKMRKDMCLVRYLPACETMGGVTQICSDKTGTLTQNRMNVTQGVVAGSYFNSPIIDHLHPSVITLLTEGIARNSLSYLEPPTSPGGFPIYVGQPTECALLNWINKMGHDYEKIRQSGPNVVLRFAFSSARKRMSTMIPKPGDDEGYRLYTKGASEIILDRCISMLDSDGYPQPLTEEKKAEYLNFIEQMAGKGLRTIALAYRDFDFFDFLDKNNNNNNEEVDPHLQAEYENATENRLVLIGLTGIEDPVRVEVPKAVRTCQEAGITVRMVTGDNVLTAKSIAAQCNIWKEGLVALEGPEFAKMSDDEIDKVLPKLVILARSSPSDKIRLVKRLKANKELVAVTGDGTNDAPALRGAHIGLAMGGGTEVARDASDIIILDDNFSSIVKAVMWGRSVFDNIRKFLQFQLTVNVSAMAIAALSALVNLQPLTAVQLLWVNLIMDSLGALALATERPTDALLTRPPKNISHPNYSLLSPEMWKMIIGQSIYQIFVLYGGLFLIPILVDTIEEGSETLDSIVFNSFIWCQLFNLISCRKINPREFNIFEKFFSNWLFLIVLLIEFVIQFFLVGINLKDEGEEGERIMPFLDFIGVIFTTVPLTPIQWAFCIAVGFVGFLWGFILKLFPTPPEKIYKGEIGDIHHETSPLVDYVEKHLRDGETEDLRPNPPLITRAPTYSSSKLRTLSNSGIVRKSKSDVRV